MTNPTHNGNKTTIIALSGSLKENSFNRKLVNIAAEGAETADAEVIHINLADFPIPLFSEDLEAEGTPAPVNDLKQIFADADGILLASPEYNGSVTGVLKNTIDWLSRPGKSRSGESADIGSAFAGKAVGLLATSPGGLGGLRGLSHARDILFNLGAIINPNQIAVPGAFQAFDGEGRLTDENMAERVKGLGADIARLAGQIKA